MSFLSRAKALRAEQLSAPPLAEPARGALQGDEVIAVDAGQLDVRPPQHEVAAQPIAVVPPCPSTVTERAALIETGDGCGPAEADRRALAEFGLASWGELADAHAAVVCAALDCLPTPSTNGGHRLMKLTRDFLGTAHWQRAIKCGWPLLELFGVHNHAPLRRIEGWGLITHLAWTRLVGPKLDRIEPAAAIIQYRSGSQLSHRVGEPGMSASVLWWQCPAIVADAAASG